MTSFIMNLYFMALALLLCKNVMAGHEDKDYGYKRDDKKEKYGYDGETSTLSYVITITSIVVTVIVISILIWRCVSKRRQKPTIILVKKRQSKYPTLTKIPSLPEELTVFEYLPDSNVPKRPETVICVHGWGGKGFNFFKFIPKLQEKGFRVLAPDFPQHGMTEGPETGAHSFAHSINLLIRYVDGPVYFITHSLGNVGYWANSTFSSQKEKDAVKRYVGIGIPHVYNDILVAFENIIGLSGRSHPYFLEEHARWFGDEFTKEAVFGKMINDLNIPTLLIHDKNDKELAFDLASETATYLSKKHYKIKNSGEIKPTFFESEGLGHRRILRDDGIVDRVVEFLSEDIEIHE
ncbi:hypothetical protein PIROE2DRAFT_68452 [Piromyces sp. E2]|nr:hypothetical protein PIROE2DRAFT_68452 [Piromyces sp. E2]|eukprot:OUM69961.1 hypothetical protein PIROE2DRAFT_68452 [Piromyces sp. E2]